MKEKRGLDAHDADSAITLQALAVRDFEALKCAEVGMALTESWAMTPAASVSGFYMAHPGAAYSNVGKIGEDQVEDWVRRSAQGADQVRRSLGRRCCSATARAGTRRAPASSR